MSRKRGNASLEYSGGHPVSNTQRVATLWTLDAMLLLEKSHQRRHQSHGVLREAYIGNVRLPMFFVVLI